MGLACSFASATSSDSEPVSEAGLPQKPYCSAMAPISSTAARELVVRSAASRLSSYIERSDGPPCETGRAYVLPEHVDSPNERPCSLLIA